MARTAILNKTKVLECAFKIAKERGKNSVTIREIARQLKCSTAAIYTQYENIETIFSALTEYIQERIFQSTQINRTENSFLNIGVGYIAFVLENKLIYNDFYLTMENPLFGYKRWNNTYLDQMRQNPLISVLSDEQLESILYDMTIYTFGLATIICTGADGEHNLDYYQTKLEQNGNSIMNYYLYSSGKYEEVIYNLIKNSN